MLSVSGAFAFYLFVIILNRKVPRTRIILFIMLFYLFITIFVGLKTLIHEVQFFLLLFIIIIFYVGFELTPTSKFI